jgi:hypothetical protein
MAIKYVMDRDLGMRNIMRQFYNAQKAELVVGVLEGSKNADGENIAEYATYNEFGTDSIPERPAMRTAFDENKPKYIRAMTKIVQEMGQKTFASMITQLGFTVEKDIQKTITGRDFLPKLSEQTIKRKKGSTKTLVDTGAYVNSIKHLIRK